MPTASDMRRYRRNLQSEIDGAAIYRAMAEREKEAGVAQVYRDLAAIEERHARFWRDQLETAGAKVDAVLLPSWRARVLMAAARRFGVSAVLPTMAAQEKSGRNVYASQPEAEKTRMTAQERIHARVLRALLARTSGVEGSQLARMEGRHGAVGGNMLRAAVLGANDGLCSNLSLVMGVAGATSNAKMILVTGLAGLLAGACSMALGEWVSVTSSRELAAKEIAEEKEELELSPEDEREELELIYQAKGLEKEEAGALSRQLIADPTAALGVLAREELGLDPNDLGGSAGAAAATSFFLFALGAVIPIAPYFFLGGNAAIAASVGAAGLALVGIGVVITVFTGRPAWISGLRQLALGFAAAGVTFGIGKLLGVAVGG
jgi:VIT1/CCC1 family predicted Fe2+/Mn2+ transporter